MYFSKNLTRISLSVILGVSLVGCGGDNKKSSSKIELVEKLDVQSSLVDVSSKANTNNQSSVISTNQKPIASINGGQNSVVIKDGKNIRLTAEGSNDPDGSIKSYRWTDDQGNVLCKKATYDCEFKKAGKYTRCLTVTDNQGATCKTEITVIVNTPPTIEGTALSNVMVCDSYCFTPKACDTEGDNLSFSISNKPVWAHFDSASGSLSGTPCGGDEKTYDDIVITVCDSQGASASMPAFSITVDPIAEWTKLVGTGTSDLINGISSDKHGNVITVGYTKNTGDKKDKFDVNVMKISKKGDLIFSHDYNSSAHEIGYDSIVDSCDNIYITGMTKGDFGDSNRTCGSDKYPDPFVVKLDKNGNKLWGKLVCTDKAGLARGIGIDANDNVYISGNINGDLEGKASLGKNDVFIAKFDSEGEQKYLTQIGTDQNEYSDSLVVDKDGNAYVAGYTKGNLDGTNAGKDDIFVSKIATDGTIIWTYQFGSDASDKSPAIALDIKKSLLYVTGKTSGDLGAVNAGSSDIFLTAISLDGVSLWTKQYGGAELDIGEDIVVADNGNIFIAGNTNTVPNVGKKNSDITLLKVAPDGSLLSQNTYGTDAKDYAYGIAKSNCNSIYVGGYTRGDLEGEIHSGGNNDKFIMHLNADK